MYEDEKNVALTEELVKIGTKDLNLNADELKDYLENDKGASEVKHEIVSGRSKYNISGVPYFVIRRSGEDSGPPYAMSGAQSSSTLKGVLIELSKDIESDAK
jgi:predicted DsbA family dithiol-disulfide isomerase